MRSICLLHLHPWPGEGCVRRGARTPGVARAGGSIALTSGEKLDLRVTWVKQTPCLSVPFGHGYLWGEGRDKGRGRKIK